MLRDYAGTPSHALRRHPALRGRRRPDPAQARGPQPHRRPQDPQRARPGAADQADGQDPGDRRDRRRPARRRLAPPPRPTSAWTARSTWARSTPSARRSTSPGCSCSAPRSCRSTPAARTLKDAINEALRDWVASVDHTAYLFGTAAGPHPFPSMVRDFTRGIGDEARAQCLRAAPARCPTRSPPAWAAGPTRSACSPASSTTPTCAIFGFEAGGDGVDTGAARGDHPRPARSGCCTARAPSCCRTRTARPIESHSISAGLDYPGVGPEHAHLADERPRDLPARSPTPRPWTPSPCSPAPRASSRRSSPPTPSPARCAWPELGPDATILVNLSGRGDKDMGTAIEWFGLGRPTTTAEDRVTDEPSRARSRRPAPEDRAALVGYLPGRLPRRRRPRSRRCGRWSRPAATSSRSGCPTATR